MKNLFSIVFVFYSLVSGFAQTCHPKAESFSKDSIVGVMQKLADWQVANFTYRTDGNLHDYGIDSWTNATFYVGMLQWGLLSPENTYYLNWLKEIGEDTNWTLPENFSDNPRYEFYHADELCIGQTYLELYHIYKEEKMLSGVKDRIDRIISNPPDTSMSYKNKKSLTWSDAIFMSPPVYAGLAAITGDDAYLEFMQQQVYSAHRHLFDKEERLYFRDDSYFSKREDNGEKVFWGRGNGWVIAGVANILKLLPQDSPYRPFYEEILIEISDRLAFLQDDEGFWHASLLDPDSYPAPETSATALIAYGLAYGINNNIISSEKYMPSLQKSWRALLSAVCEDGRLGWVQPIGADPKEVTRDMTQVYGVGAFLLAGSEIYKMAN